MFDELYADISDQLAAQKPPNGFNIEDLFSKDEWLSIGDGHARQRFGTRFSNDVKKGVFAGVTRNKQANEKGGNESRYNYDPAAAGVA